jgi:hypothetical protein
MRLGERYVDHINRLFVNSDFRKKDAGTIREILEGDFPKSETPVLVRPDSIDVDEEDSLTTKVTFSWDDYSFAFFMNWRKNESGNGYILSRALLAGAPETLG